MFVCLGCLGCSNVCDLCILLAACTMAMHFMRVCCSFLAVYSTGGRACDYRPTGTPQPKMVFMRSK